MKPFSAAVIAIVASALICVQNLPYVTAFTWALIHGVGLGSVLAFVPAGTALVVLWVGYGLTNIRPSGRPTLVFATFAIGVVVLNEVLLPVTPLKEWTAQRAIERVRVSNVRDEPLLSVHGNPIGVRILFDAVVPRTAAYGISPATLSSASGEMIWPLQFGHARTQEVEPPPTSHDSPYDVFQKGVTYRFHQDMLPNFLEYDEKTQTVCLAEVRTTFISETDFLSGLAANRDVSLRMEIQVTGEYGTASVVAANLVTSRRYDMQAIYDTIGKEGGRRCKH